MNLDHFLLLLGQISKNLHLCLSLVWAACIEGSLVLVVRGGGTLGGLCPRLSIFRVFAS